MRGAGGVEDCLNQPLLAGVVKRELYSLRLIWCLVVAC